jgi:hypothetical protein
VPSFLPYQIPSFLPCQISSFLPYQSGLCCCLSQISLSLSLPLHVCVFPCVRSFVRMCPQIVPVFSVTLEKKVVLDPDQNKIPLLLQIKTSEDVQ